MMKNCPYDEFHLLFEGLTKLIIKRLFEASNTNTSRAVMTRWREALDLTSTFSESARRPRKIETGKLKGSEFGFILHTGFPVLVDILEDIPGW